MAIATLLALGFVTLFAGLGGYPLFDPSEGRHAAVAREMADRGQWLVPVLYEEPYYDKPAPFYWLLRAASRLPIADEAAARLPSALATMAVALLLYGFARKRLGGRAALAGGVVFLSCPAVIGLARFANQDALLAACVTAATLRWLAWIERPAATPWSAYALMGAGALVKGPVALALPLLVAAACATARGALRDRAGRADLVRGLALSAAIFLAWLVPAAISDPVYVRAFLLDHNLARYLSADVGHPQPAWYFAPVLAAMLLPWTLALPAALTASAARGARPAAAGRATADPRPVASTDASAIATERDLLLWAAVIVVFFSLSRAKLAPYALPAVAPLALWIGLRLDRVARLGGEPAERAERRLRGALAVWAFLLAAIPIGVWIWLRIDFPRLAAAALWAAPLPVVAAIGVRLAWRAPRRLGATLPTLAAGNVALVFVGYLGGAPTAAEVASDAGLARIADELAPGVPIVGFRLHPASMSFYAAAPVRKAREVEPVLRMAAAGPLLVVARAKDVAPLSDAGLALHRWTECERHCLFATLPRPDGAGPAPATTGDVSDTPVVPRRPS